MKTTIAPSYTTCPGSVLGTEPEEAGRLVYSTALGTGWNEGRRRPWSRRCAASPLGSRRSLPQCTPTHGDVSQRTREGLRGQTQAHEEQGVVGPGSTS